MTNTGYAAKGWEGSTMGYCTVESLLDEAAFNLRRYSRGSGGQRTEKSGGSMRIVKPSSASNSPRGSMALGRRRTVMYDRRRMITDHNSGNDASNDRFEHPAKSNRPVSWHPSTHLQQPQQIYQHADSTPILNTSNEYHRFDLPPTPTVYSSYGSPSSTFSPVSVPFTGYSQQQYQYSESSTYPSACNYTTYQQSATLQQAPLYLSTPTETTDSQMCSQLDWQNFASNGFDRSTAPPTPENFLPIQHPSPSFPKEEAIPYHPLSEDPEEEEGEILCGLGLYDTPDVLKSVPSDPQLDNYRSSVSQLLGSAYRKEPSGQGLKLEETWNPPNSDDEEDEDEDEADGEGDLEEDSALEKAQEVKITAMETAPKWPQRTRSFENLTWL